MKPCPIIDAHTHPAGPAMESVDGYTAMKEVMLGKPVEVERVETITTYMDKHGVDQAIGLVSIGLSRIPEENDKIIEVAKSHPDRFPAVMVGFSTPRDYSDFDGEATAKELESYLKIPEVKGVGEWSLRGAMEDWPQLWARCRPIMDVIAEHKKVAHFHSGDSPYPGRVPRTRSNGKPGWSSTRRLWLHNPVFIDDIATEYPDVPIIIAHIGVQGFFYFGTYADMALLVAARNVNVYLETSSAPFEVVEKAAVDPAIGPEKLVFGTDTPAPFGYYRYQDKIYPSYGKTPPPYSPDHYSYDLSVINQLPIHDKEKQMILGGNISRLLGL